MLNPRFAKKYLQFQQQKTVSTVQSSWFLANPYEINWNQTFWIPPGSTWLIKHGVCNFHSQVSPSWYSPIRMPTDLVAPVPARGRCWSTMAPNSKARQRRHRWGSPESWWSGFHLCFVRFSCGFPWIFGKMKVCDEEKGMFWLWICWSLGERLNNFKLVLLFHFWIAVAKCRLKSCWTLKVWNMPGACVSDSCPLVRTILMNQFHLISINQRHPLTLSMRVVKVKLESRWSCVTAGAERTWSFRWGPQLGRSMLDVESGPMAGFLYKQHGVESAWKCYTSNLHSSQTVDFV